MLSFHQRAVTTCNYSLLAVWCVWIGTYWSEAKRCQAMSRADVASHSLPVSSTANLGHSCDCQIMRRYLSTCVNNGSRPSWLFSHNYCGYCQPALSDRALPAIRSSCRSVPFLLVVLHTQRPGDVSVFGEACFVCLWEDCDKPVTTNVVKLQEQISNAAGIMQVNFQLNCMTKINITWPNKKLCYRRQAARCFVSVSS